MRSFSILVFLLSLLSWSGASYAVSPLCPAQSFHFTAPTKAHGEGKVEKKGCMLRFLTFLGQGEKFEVDVCENEVEILRYGSVVDSKAMHIGAGSAHCPAPLFGADFSGHSGSADDYTNAKQRIREILREVKAFYVTPGKKTATKRQQDAQAKIACMEDALKAYLDDCEPQSWNEN